MQTFIMKLAQNGHAEDDAIIDDQIAVVCDGLGGLGSSTLFYDGKEVKAAWLASRICCMAVRSYFEKNFLEYKNYFENNADDTARNEYLLSLINSLKNYINNYANDFCIDNNIIIQNVKSLPTTLAIIISQETSSSIELTAIWAGDSRIYSLSSDSGLQQLSRDDTKSTDFDAHFQIGSSEMSNCIEINKPFYLNYKHYVFPRKDNQIFFCCSDGCFDGLKSIMDLEFHVLNSIMQLPDNSKANEFIDILSDSYKSSLIYSEGLIDDTTISGFLFNPTDSNIFKEQYYKRYEALNQIHNKIIDWQKNNRMVDEARPTVLEDNQIKQKFRKTAVAVCSVVLSEKSLSDNDHKELYDSIISLPVFTRYRLKCDESNSDYKKLIKESETKLRLIFNDAFLEHICSNTKARKYAISQIEDIENQQNLSEELEIYARYINNKLQSITDQTEFFSILEKLNRLRKQAIENVNGEKTINCDILYKYVSSVKKDLENAINIINRLESIDTSYSISDLKLFADGLIKKLNSYGITNSAYNQWINSGMKPIGNESSQAEIIEALNDLQKIKVKEKKKYQETHMMLQSIIKFSAEQITSQFIGVPEIVFNPCLDNEENIDELRNWLDRHQITRNRVSDARKEIDMIWQEQYKSQYEMYNMSKIGGRSE